jgi:REP element-mobilizing transposase RayT
VFTLVAPAREIVRSTIRAHCEFRGWTLHAANVRTNDVHVVVSAEHPAPKIVMEQFKAWTTRRLREGRVSRPDAPVWAEHGSSRCLWNDEDLHAAIEYVLESQGETLD